MELDSDTRMGDFLRAQRARLSPAEVGLPSTGPRRLRGLRREEVAVLAGVSADYYARIEQGRERTPSPQVAEALSTALRLGQDGRDYLFRLARLAPLTIIATAQVSDELQHTVNSFSHAAAIVTDPASRIVASNSIGEALFAPLADSGTITEALFLDPTAHQFYVDWAGAARAEICALRLAMSYSPPHPEVADLVNTLSNASDDFRSMWNDQYITGPLNVERVIDHPKVGLLRLAHQRFDVRSTSGLELIVLTAAPGSQSAAALNDLADASGIDVRFAGITRSLESGGHLGGRRP